MSKLHNAALQALSSSLKLSVTLDRLCHVLRETFPMIEGAFANYYVAEEQSLQLLANVDGLHVEELNERLPVPENVAELARTRPHGVYVVDRVEDDLFTATMGVKMAPRMQSFVLVKNQIEGKHLGVVIFWSSEPGAIPFSIVETLSKLQPFISLNVGFAVADRLARYASVVAKANKALTAQQAQERDAPLLEILSTTPSLTYLADKIRRGAPVDATVLITGESGTGKDVIANVIHQLSRRKHRPFVKVNCAAITPSLIEAELFGWEKGAFTDARERHAGLFEQAEGGTLFLDEIGELSPELQVKLLRVLQQGTLRRLGASQEIRVDVRIIAATHQDLPARVKAGAFRLDLYYRLNVYPLHLLPLRDRLEDLEPLMTSTIKQLTKKYGLASEPVITPAAMAQARAWPWPGNIRELINVLTRAVLTQEGVIEHLPFEAISPLEAPASRVTPVAPLASLPSAGNLAEMDFEACQRAYFETLLKATQGRISGPLGAAARAGLHPNTLRSRLDKLGVSYKQAWSE